MQKFAIFAKFQFSFKTVKRMSKKHGANTIEIAKKLTEQFKKDPKRYKDVEVYYDHGSSKNDNVCAPTVNIGRRYGNDATLGATDIVVVSDSKVLIAVEIEESGVSPKRIIGDIFSLVLGDRIKIKKKQYSLKEDLVVLVVVLVKDTGKSSQKYIRLERHLNKFIRTIDIKYIRKIRILPISLVEIVERTERLIRLEIGKCL